MNLSCPPSFGAVSQKKKNNKFFLDVDVAFFNAKKHFLLLI